jgi:hypothetical protein
MSSQTEELGIQIDVPVSIQDAVEAAGGLSLTLSILIASSFIFLLFGITLLLSDMLNWPLQNSLYSFLMKLAP